jgi:hypothetical protein
MSTTEINLGTIIVEGTYYPGSPGRYTGPPENCYPAEPDEFEPETFRLTGDLDDFLGYLDDKLYSFCKAHGIVLFTIYDLMEEDIMTKLGAIMAERDEALYDQIQEERLMGLR